MKIGLLGIGHLAAYLVQGAQGAGHEFLLSPRNPGKAAELARRYGCEVAASNQAVVDACDHILVCLPAAQGLEILAGLTFRAGQEVCSAMAGAALAAVQAAIGPARATVSMMPGYANAFAAGPTLLHPAHSGWAGFFTACGPAHEIPDPHQFETAAVFGAMSGASLHFLRHLAAWYEAEGLDPTTARRLVAETFRGNAEVLLQSEAPLDTIYAGVTTPGGITEQLLSDLDRDGALEAWHRGMTRILHRMAPARKR
ncbi:pyrroline-5-carboxylate reductase dimerization domain-containing protein [Tabrizicola oligotrophica]|uniref:NAD(P)-binding domain-containing protein n=1 Tax=Tabrizicola oligotrophica TaxID=2710650 RepID=A0A6M0QQR1_9RHOB|nr:pyrroline-5-carboxylate reductase dimerization domain-containing protein [Tabrizicola oligotrophica]NEY89798.1 NAD(P)-binding domain-containing protein [Tabrizicola oligotrophica]